MGLLDLLGLGSPPPPPPQPDPNGLASILNLGSIDQRHKLLQSQFDQAQQIAGGVPIDYSKGKGTPLLLAGLANLVSAGVGGYQEGKATGGLRDLVGEQTAGRKAGLDLGTSWSPPDLTKVQTASDADLPGQMQTAQSSVGVGRRLGMALSLSGDPNLVGIGKNIVSQSDEAQQSLQSMPQTRLQQAIEKRKLLNEGPSENLGGLSPTEAKAKAELESAEKPIVVPMGSAMADRKGKILTTGGGAGGYSPEAIDALARKSITTGNVELPKGINRAQSTVLAKQVLDRMLELDPTGNMAEHAASSKADSASLSAQQKILDNAESWESTGKANLQNLLAISQKLANTGSPWLNKPVRAFLQGATGDPDIVAFKAAHNAVVNEYAKILSGASGSGSVTEGARHEAESMIPLDATPQQMAAAASVLNTDADNRIGSARQQVATIKSRLGGQTTATAPVAAPPPGAPKTGARVNLFDPAGKPINLPASQVEAYLAATPGAKRAP